MLDAFRSSSYYSFEKVLNGDENKIFSVPTTKITKKETRFVEGVMGARNLLKEILKVE
jgi:hypothetical protein